MSLVLDFRMISALESTIAFLSAEQFQYYSDGGCKQEMIKRIYK